MTRRRVCGLLAALCVAEAAFAVVAWRAPPPARPAARSGAPPAAVAGMPQGAALKAPPLDSFAAFVARPLFLASRRPAPVAAARSAKPTDTSAKGVLFGPYRFTGIVVTPRVRIAFVTESKTGRSIALAEGDRLGEWRCARITPGSVTLEKGGRREVIDLHAPR